MTFEERLTAAHQELESKGVWHANYNPPLCRLLRRLGYPVKPPHYEDWLTNSLAFGISFGLVWGMMMWFFSWRPMGTVICPAPNRAICRIIRPIHGIFALATAQAA